jgi:hypothetical protein
MTKRASCSIRFLGFVLAGFLLTVSLPRSFAQVQLPVEKVPTFLGIDLPLHPGEQLVPWGDSGCSHAKFVPGTESIQFGRSLKEAQWAGACRFGLVHGRGYYSYEKSGPMGEYNVLYGVEVPRSVSIGLNGRVYRTFWSGNAFNGLDTEELKFQSDDPSMKGEINKLDDLENGWQKDSMLSYIHVDMTGIRTVSYTTSRSAEYLCNTELSGDYKVFAQQIKRDCDKRTEPQFLVGRKDNGVVTWIKLCPGLKPSGHLDCGRFLHEAFGGESPKIDSLIAGSEEAIKAAIRERIERYAPLEAAVEARATIAAQAKGMMQ